jgi:uncharacterized membrane protein YraQ (UPF0718 family)
MMKKTPLQRYLPFFITAAIFAAFVVLFPAYRQKSLTLAVFQAKSMLLIIPPVFILLGLIDVWVPRERMIRFMGKGSGFRGTILAFMLGSFAAGPLYGAFPFAAVLMKKGASLMNILIFIGAWSTTKIPLLLFEVSSMGPRFMLSRLAIDLVGIFIIAWTIQRSLSEREVERMYQNAAEMDR